MNERDVERGAAVAFALHVLREAGLTAEVSVEIRQDRADNALEALSVNLPGYRDAIVIYRNPGESVEAFKSHIQSSLSGWRPNCRPLDNWRYDRQFPFFRVPT